jgi:hypothetical protein
VNDLSRARETADAAVRLFDRRGISHGAPTIRDPQNYLGKRELDALFVLEGEVLDLLAAHAPQIDLAAARDRRTRYGARR